MRLLTSGAGLALDAAAGTSHHGRVQTERDLPPAQSTTVGHEPTQPARHRARAQQARVLRLPPRDSERRRACARAPRHNRRWLGAGRRSWHVALRRSPKERGLSPARCSFTAHRSTTISAAWRVRTASSSGASLSRDSERRRAPRARCVTNGASLALDIAAGLLHNDRASGRGLSAAQCRFTAHWPTTASAAWHAHAANSSDAPLPPETASSGARVPRSGAGLAVEAVLITVHFTALRSGCIDTCHIGHCHSRWRSRRDDYPNLWHSRWGLWGRGWPRRDVCTPMPLGRTHLQFIDTRNRAAVPMRACVGFDSSVVGVDLEIILGCE